MNAVIVANGELNVNARVKEIWQRADVRIAADGGARNAREKLGLAPQVIIGDLDSLDPETAAWLEQNRVEKLQYPRAKDATDLELALNLAQARGAEHITILGALGGRMDHSLANVLLLSRAPQVVITDATSEMWVATQSATIEGVIGDTVSLLPLDERVEGIVTTNLEFPLRAETLARASTRGISNVMTAAHAELKWRNGLLLVVHLFDGTLHGVNR